MVTYLHDKKLFLFHKYSPCLLSRRFLPIAGLGHVVFVGTRIWPNVSWFRWQSVEVHLDRHPRASGTRPQALTFLGRARFIVWLLRCLFLGELRRDPRHFWNCWACLIRMTNTDFLPAVEPDSFGRSLLPTALTLILYICSVYSIHLFHQLSLLSCFLSGP